MKLDSSTAAIVTGGASGLGEATARRLASHGVKVAILDLQKDRGEKLAAEIGGIFCETDVTREDSIDGALAKARAAHGIERVLVNCAGIGPAKRVVSKKRDTGELTAHDLATFQKTIQVNLVGTFLMMSKCALAMAGNSAVDEDGQRGVIISTASVAAEDGQIGQVAYAASKGGVLAMTLPVARDLAQYAIRVMTIAPGLFVTPMMASLPPEVQKSLGEMTPFPSRLGTAEEYAQLVESIIANPMLNGETIRLDGAIRMAPK